MHLNHAPIQLVFKPLTAKLDPDEQSHSVGLLTSCDCTL